MLASCNPLLNSASRWMGFSSITPTTNYDNINDNKSKTNELTMMNGKEKKTNLIIVKSATGWLNKF